MDEKVYLILLEKGLLAVVLVFVTFLFNWVLQAIQLRGETAKDLISDRSKAYIELWKGLAEIRPLSNEEVTPEKAQEMEKFLVDWYHNKANALYMSWNTTRKYMLVRQALEEHPIDSQKIRKRISRLRTQLKVDCGIYTDLEAFLPLPTPSPKKSANKAN